MDEIEKLKRENEKLKEMNENKSDLISISAHQLRTSLSALKWTFRMLLNKELGEINEAQNKYLSQALQSSEKTIALVNDLLTLNHSDDTSIAFHFKLIDIKQIMDQVISEFQGELKSKKIDLSFIKPDQGLPNIKGDEEMITVVFQNLLENAIKYSQMNGSISIALEHLDTERQIKISVHDNGIGIGEEDQIKIFNKFFRAPNAVEKEIIGSGLGLFTTKSIVERHNGKIWFESSRETGTTFFVILPIS